ncbi:MAG: bifunctional folylpolyglutamate synthase/dihydrofolate synthase [Cytophagaceae bacterium]|nr:bifunctional folylpolyglutamate synthase/dihydrofolate synthase [Cytophagaceae bacterium]
MTYQETIDYLYHLLPVFHRTGASAYKPNLTNTINLCAHLGNPQTKFKSIHVAGTNGKGSTSHMLAAILQSAGYKVGLYTSPHLKDFSERIRVNGQPIAQERVISFVDENRIFIQSVLPSFFELTVGMAFQEFARQQVDIAVVEVGLGGRLDSTNIITPILSLITSIGYDHMDILGDTLPLIAAEKAGIIKPGIPVVISERQSEVEAIFRDVAARNNSPLYFASDRFIIEKHGYDRGNLRIELLDQVSRNKNEWTLELPGTYQMKNLPGVMQAIDLLREQGFELSDEAIKTGLAQTITRTGLKGRWQKIGDNPLTYVDTGHNEAGIKAILECIQSVKHRQLWMILGFVKDKDLERVLRLLPTTANYVFCESNLPRALPAIELAEVAKSFGLRGSIRHNVNEALQFARDQADPDDDLVVVGGSTFVIAEINGI